MPKTNKEETATVSFRISLEDKDKLLKIADEQDRTLSQLVRIIVSSYLKDK